MQRRVVVVSAAAAVLGLSAAALGFAAEAFKNKALVGSNRFRCEYRRTAALPCGILAALLSLAAAALVTAASGCFGRYDVNAPVAWSWRGHGVRVCATLAWLLVVAAAAMFLYGASRNAGGTGGLSPAVTRGGRYNNGGRNFVFVCAVLKRGVFSTASIAAAVGIACAVAAYVELQKRDGLPAHSQGVAMGQLQWSQPQPHPPPVAYPPPPPPPYGAYGTK